MSRLGLGLHISHTTNRTTKCAGSWSWELDGMSPVAAVRDAMEPSAAAAAAGMRASLVRGIISTARNSCNRHAHTAGGRGAFPQ